MSPDGASSPSGDGEMSPDGQFATQNGDSPGKESLDSPKDVSDGESILRMEDHKRRTEDLLSRFQKSHFFVRIAESGEPLWSKKSSPVEDTEVSLQVYIVDCPKEPITEILQFEKHQDRDRPSENNKDSDHEKKDPYGNLLKWLIPLDNTSASSSQLFSFGHFRSYSISALPPNSAPVTGPVKAQSFKPSFDLEDWDSYSSQQCKMVRSLGLKSSYLSGVYHWSVGSLFGVDSKASAFLQVSESN